MNYPQMMKDINIFVDGVGHLGTSEEIKLPTVKFKKESIERGGFEKDVNLGTFEKLEAEFTLSEYSPAIYAAMAAGTATGLGVNITVKGSITQNGKHIPSLATLQGDIEVDDGSWKANSKVERKVKMSVNLYAMHIDGKEAILLDTENMIAIIDGVDYLADLRTHIQ
jgi:P2 family phage contractile tail tube protein